MSIGMRKTGFVALAVRLCIAAAACGTIGSGDVVSEERDIGSFDSLEISDGVNVELLVDPGAVPSVSVSIDDNLLDQLVTEVRGSTLVIEFDGSVTILSGDHLVSVTIDSVERIDASGGADLTGTGLDDEYRVEASGGADVDLSDLEAKAVEVDVSGGADVRVFATESIEGEVSGGANVTVFGDPDRSRIDTSGGADVEYDG